MMDYESKLLMGKIGDRILGVAEWTLVLISVAWAGRFVLSLLLNLAGV